MAYRRCVWRPDLSSDLPHPTSCRLSQHFFLTAAAATAESALLSRRMCCQASVALLPWQPSSPLSFQIPLSPEAILPEPFIPRLVSLAPGLSQFIFVSAAAAASSSRLYL
ncbi:hypothetical protein HPB50_017147 [Hyalomma asiaticum]|uniref:Uncharacterized protein n=1 Tax=Hyalomma asiaticum TaxID=266040 RepID=A0ACB7T869_HYAAI|nr:hypothetical protein HPB50_017147 [Hyalomma asiaticum]